MGALTGWAMSPTYGQMVALGPTQALVYNAVMDLTSDGRRPELTLGRLAALVGRPVSSVHAALGRLRALGLIGVSARTGRNGRHRLWRVVQRAERGMDRARHRIAVARIRRRWPAVGIVAPRSAATLPLALSYGDPEPSARPDRLGVGVSGGTPPTSGPGLPSDRTRTADPDDPYPRRGDPRETFGERMRRHGLGAWIDERKR